VFGQVEKKEDVMEDGSCIVVGKFLAIGDGKVTVVVVIKQRLKSLAIVLNSK